MTTQIIAANNDINQSKEILVRLQKRLTQLALVKSFLEETSHLVDKTFNGLELCKQLLEVESGMRSKLASGDTNGQEFFDQLRSQFLVIEARFTKGLEANTAPTANRDDMTKAAARGMAVAFLLVLLVLLCQRVWMSVKSK